MHTGVGKDRVGPGAYQIANVSETHKGPSWHKTGPKKGLEMTKKANNPGPGHYSSEKTDIFPIYKYKPSSVFASKVDRVRNPGV